MGCVCVCLCVYLCVYVCHVIFVGHSNVHGRCCSGYGLQNFTHLQLCSEALKVLQS